MKRKLTLMLALLFVWTGVAWSQGVTVKGVVTAENGAYPPNQNGLIHPQLSLKWA